MLRNEVVYGIYVDGKLVMASETDLEEKMHSLRFYPNGKKMIQSSWIPFFGGEEEYFDDDGKLLLAN